MPITKTALREQLKQARLELPAAERAANSAAIVNQLKQAIDWSEATTLHCYEPIPSLNEVDISSFISTLQVEHPNIKIYTPQQVNDAWQIPNIKFDVIIVPMLGFDPETLHRIGYGGGYYDKFLATQPQAKKIGVCFAQGKVKHIPSVAHDVALDRVITD